MTFLLNWVGARARWVLLVGVFAGLAVPAAAEALRPVLPFFVAMVYALAMLRIDPVAILRGLADPAHAARALGVVALMLIVTPLAAFAVVRMLGLGADMEAIVIYTFAAPPIASSAGMCLIVAFRGETALELTVLSSLIMPITGPVIAGFFTRKRTGPVACHAGPSHGSDDLWRLCDRDDRTPTAWGRAHSAQQTGP